MPGSYDIETSGLHWPGTPRKTLSMKVIGADKTISTLRLTSNRLEGLQSFVRAIKADQERSRKQFAARRKRYIQTVGHRDRGAGGPLRKVERLTREAHKLRRQFRAAHG